MKTLTTCFIALSALIASTSSFADTVTPYDVLSSLWKLGAAGTEIVPSVGTALRTDVNGNQIPVLNIYYALVPGGGYTIADDVTVYESPNNSQLVMTYYLDWARSSQSRVTRIIEINTDESRNVAEFVKANATPRDASRPDLKITAYSLKQISCSHSPRNLTLATCTVKQ